jgi:hypothetical protein
MAWFSKTVEKGSSKFADKLIKSGLIGSGITAVGGAGYLGGRLHEAKKFNTALSSFNNAENQAIAEQYYQQGLSDKTASLLKNRVVKIILSGGGVGGVGYLGGRLHQNLKNQELANAFNAYNKEENTQIARSAYEYGKTASLIGDVAESFSSIPRYIKWKGIQAKAGYRKVYLQKLQKKHPAMYDKLDGLNKEIKYDRILDRAPKKIQEHYDKTGLARGIVASLSSATGGFGIGRLVPERHKEKLKEAISYVQSKQHQ